MAVRRFSGARPVALAASVSGAVGVGSLVFCGWLWVRSAGIGFTLTHLLPLNRGEALVTGLVSADLMVLQVFCLARLPWLERAWGRDVLVRLHRWCAWWSFWLMLAHVYLFALTAALRNPGRGGAALERVFLTDRYMLIATIGTVLIVAVVATSVRRAVRRLRYESWHLLHLWSYVGIGLALPHQLIATDFGTAWVRTAWWLWYLLALVAVLGFRVARPLQVSFRHRVRVAGVRRELGVVVVTMTGRDLERLGARPGDFLTWRFLGGRPRQARLAGHSYSLSSVGDHLEIAVSEGSAEASRLAGLEVGTRVLVEGPYGALADRLHGPVLLLGAGVGVTPLAAILDAAAPGSVVLVHRFSGEQPLGPTLASAVAEGGHRMVGLPGPRRPGSWLPASEPDDEVIVLRRLVPDLAQRAVVVCGPEGWSAAVCRTLAEAGVPRRRIHTEQFSWWGPA